jgi:hypothetical protein
LRGCAARVIACDASAVSGKDAHAVAPAFTEPQVRRNCDFLRAHNQERPLSAEKNKRTRQAEEWTMYRELVAP